MNTFDYFKKHKIWKKILGVALVLIGIFSLLTPLTPGSWLAIIGLEILGVRFLLLDKLKEFLKKHIKK